MIGLVLVTHGRLADEFRAALEHVMGPQKQIEAITIGAEDDFDLCRNDIIEAVNRVDSGDGVAILTDMFGGTPSNLAISCMSRPKVEVLAGINLPMLVKLAKVREERSAARCHRHGAGSRPQIRHHRQPGARRQMSDDDAPPAKQCRDGRAARCDLPRTSDHQQARPACARLGEIRPDGRAIRSRCVGDARRRDRRRQLHHGPDDARGGTGHHDPGLREGPRGPSRARCDRRARRDKFNEEGI